MHKLWPVAWIALALAVTIPPVGSASAENLQVEPGKWEIRAESTNSMMPQPQVRTRTECVTEGEWNPDTFMQDSDGCTYSDVESSTSELAWKVTCTTPAGQMTGDAVYRSTGETVDGSMKMAMAAGGMNITADVKWEGRRIGDCD